MIEHPILFSAPMVRAILEGRKTQTRRIVKNLSWELVGDDDGSPDYGFVRRNGKEEVWPEGACPHGRPGDQLWVRETFGIPDAPYEERRKDLVSYRADESLELAELNRYFWRPSIFMPRWASRITLEITGVRVERVQDITARDAEAEGAERADHGEHLNHDGACWVEAYERLWDQINAKRAPWSSNPWVWVVQFKRVNP